jgi:hypothetical protein
VTHASIQRLNRYKTAEKAAEWRERYGKPVVIDECAYEDYVRGGYVGHGETYVHHRDTLWWSHGEELHGLSPERIAFLRRVIQGAAAPLEPIPEPEGSLFDPYWEMTIQALEG